MNNICYQNSLRIFFTFLYFPPPIVLGLEMWRAYSSGWKQFHAYIVQFFFKSIIILFMASTDGTWVGNVLFACGRHFRARWLYLFFKNTDISLVDSSFDYQRMILNMPAEWRPHFLIYFFFVIFCVFSVWPQDWQFHWRFYYICRHPAVVQGNI